MLYENSLKVSSENSIVVDYKRYLNSESMSVMHYHPYYEMYFLLSGNRKYIFNNRIIEMKPQDVLIVKPNDFHKVIKTNNDTYERYIINVDPSMILTLKKYNKKIEEIFKKSILRLDEADFQNLINLIKIIEKEKTEEEYYYSVRNYLERILLDLLSYNSYEPIDNQLTINDVRLQDALNYIDLHYNENIKIETCAKVSCMSVSLFTKIFHKKVNKNFKEYINYIRIKKACELMIDTDLTITEISEDVGFYSLSYFGLIFKKYIGMSPKEYKMKHTN